MRRQLIDATVETAVVHGLSRLSVGDVARRAGLSRQTLYRHFPSKDALVTAAVLHETVELVERVVEAGRSRHDPFEALEASILAALVATREHPLLDRLIRTEPDTLLPLLVTDGGPVTTSVRAVVEGLLAERLPQLDAVALRRSADILTRLLVSYAVNPPDDPPEVVAAALAHMLTGSLTGSLAPTPSSPPSPTTARERAHT